MNISVIIPNYNGEKLLAKNLPEVIKSIENYKLGKLEIIISDDCSTDKSLVIIDQFVKKYLNKINILKILNSDRNSRGFAKNVNRAVSKATGDILLLLNTDVVPRLDFLDPLISHFDDELVFAVGCMDESIENGNRILRGRGIGKFQKGFLVHSKGDVDKVNTLWVSGGSGAFRKSIWNKLDGLDELYNPFYWEDIDISYRALKSGYKLMFEPKSVVSHNHTEGIIKTKFKINYIKKISYRNQLIFFWKNVTDLNLLFFHFLHLPYFLLKALLLGDLNFVRGYFMALAKFDKILKARSLVKSGFIRKDSDVVRAYEKSY